MDAHYKTLQTIFSIVKDDPQPSNYKCRPREIILRQFQDWDIIEKHIRLLEEEGLLTTRQEQTMIIQMTVSGLEKITGNAIESNGG